MPTPIQSVVAQIEEDIVLGLLRPHERLTEDSLIERFDIKRHVARQALGRLTQLGLVTHQKNVGVQVRAYTYAEIMDTYALRELLEGEAARLMPCPAQPAEVTRLRTLQANHDKAVAHADLRAIFRANMAFHSGLFSLCPNQALVEAIRFYAVQTHAIRSASAHNPTAQQRSVQEHNAMIDALADGDRATLIHLCKTHIMPARDQYLAQHRHLFPEHFPSTGSNRDS